MPIHRTSLKLGQILRAERLKRGLSQTQAGQLIGVSYQAWQKYETGASAILLVNFLRLCKAWRLSAAKLLDQVGAVK